MSDLSTLEFAPAVEKPRERVCLTPDDHAEILSNYARLNHSRWENHATLQGSKSGSSFASADSFGSRPTKVKGVPRFIPRTEVFEGGWKDDSYWDYAQSGGIESHLWGWPTEEARRQSFGGGSINPIKEPHDFIEAHLWTRTILNDLMPTPLTFILEDPKPLQNWVLKKRNFCEAYHDWFTRDPVMLEVFGVRNLEIYPVARPWRKQKNAWVRIEREAPRHDISLSVLTPIEQRNWPKTWLGSGWLRLCAELPRFTEVDDRYLHFSIRAVTANFSPAPETVLAILRRREELEETWDKSGPVHNLVLNAETALTDYTRRVIPESRGLSFPALCSHLRDRREMDFARSYLYCRLCRDTGPISMPTGSGTIEHEMVVNLETDKWHQKYPRQYADNHFQKEAWDRTIKATKDVPLPAEINPTDIVSEEYANEDDPEAIFGTTEDNPRAPWKYGRDEIGHILRSPLSRSAKGLRKEGCLWIFTDDVWSPYEEIAYDKNHRIADLDSESGEKLQIVSALPKCPHGVYGWKEEWGGLNWKGKPQSYYPKRDKPVIVSSHTGYCSVCAPVPLVFPYSTYVKIDPQHVFWIGEMLALCEQAGVEASWDDFEDVPFWLVGITSQEEYLNLKKGKRFAEDEERGDKIIATQYKQALKAAVRAAAQKVKALLKSPTEFDTKYSSISSKEDCEVGIYDFESEIPDSTKKGRREYSFTNALALAKKYASYVESLPPKKKKSFLASLVAIQRGDSIKQYLKERGLSPRLAGDVMRTLQKEPTEAPTFSGVTDAEYNEMERQGGAFLYYPTSGHLVRLGDFEGALTGKTGLKIALAKEYDRLCGKAYANDGARTPRQREKTLERVNKVWEEAVFFEWPPLPKA